MSHNRRIRTY